MVWTKMGLLNAADIYIVCLWKGLKFKFFGSHTFSFPVADVEVVAGRSILPFTSLVFRVRDASRWGWAPVRLGARHRLYLATHRDGTISISRMQHNHVIVMHRCTLYALSRRQVSSDFEGMHVCIVWPLPHRPVQLVWTCQECETLTDNYSPGGH